MLNLKTITNKNPEALLSAEKTLLRRNIRKLSQKHLEKFSKILAESDPNIGEEIIPTDKLNIPEEQ